MQTTIGKDIDHAAELLRRGDLVAIPTETVYGLAANALDEEAVLKIYEAKQRPRFNPLILHLPSLEACEGLVTQIPHACRRLADRFSPGGLTYLLPRTERVPDLVTAGLDRVALRVPAHPMTLDLLNRIDFPLAAPSANPSGYISPTTPGHVLQGLEGRIPYILDGGGCRLGLESTIVGFESDHIALYRYGAVSVEEIEETSGLSVEVHGHDDTSPAPGMQKSHYAPSSPFVVGDISVLAAMHAGKRIAAVCFSGDTAVPDGILSRHILSQNGELHEAAANLFRILREVDAEEPDIAIAEWVPDRGIGRAINDRLDRARSEWR